MTPWGRESIRNLASIIYLSIICAVQSLVSTAAGRLKESRYVGIFSQALTMKHIFSPSAGTACRTRGERFRCSNTQFKQKMDSTVTVQVIMPTNCML